MEGAPCLSPASPLPPLAVAGLTSPVALLSLRAPCGPAVHPPSVPSTPLAVASPTKSALAPASQVASAAPPIPPLADGEGAAAGLYTLAPLSPVVRPLGRRARFSADVSFAPLGPVDRPSGRRSRSSADDSPAAPPISPLAYGEGAASGLYALAPLTPVDRPLGRRVRFSADVSLGAPVASARPHSSSSASLSPLAGVTADARRGCARGGGHRFGRGGRGSRFASGAVLQVAPAPPSPIFPPVPLIAPALPYASCAAASAAALSLPAFSSPEPTTAAASGGAVSAVPPSPCLSPAFVSPALHRALEAGGGASSGSPPPMASAGPTLEGALGAPLPSPAPVPATRGGGSHPLSFTPSRCGGVDLAAQVTAEGAPWTRAAATLATPPPPVVRCALPFPSSSPSTSSPVASAYVIPPSFTSLVTSPRVPPPVSPSPTPMRIVAPRWGCVPERG